MAPQSQVTFHVLIHRILHGRLWHAISGKGRRAAHARRPLRDGEAGALEVLDKPVIRRGVTTPIGVRCEGLTPEPSAA